MNVMKFFLVMGLTMHGAFQVAAWTIVLLVGLFRPVLHIETLQTNVALGWLCLAAAYRIYRS